MRAKTFLKIGLISLIIVPFVFYFLLKRSLAPIEGTIVFNGLKNPVEVIRDRYGIPHIKSQSRLDAYRALGFVMASERLFQLDLLRRLGSGRLSEVFGKKALETDKLYRTLRFREAAAERMAAGLIPQEVLQGLEAYFEGINYYKNNYPLPYEFSLLGYMPEDFTSLDAYGLIGYMGYKFSQVFKQDLFFGSLNKILTPKLIDQLRVEPSLSSKKMFAIKKTKPFHDWEKNIDIIPQEFDGSNAWAVSSKRSKSGKPLFASDPHMSFSSPGILFEAHIIAEQDQWEFYGNFLPLIPFPVMGHNQKLGWGLTISYVDDADLYQEEVHPIESKVMYKGEWVPLIRYIEKIKIKGEADYSLPVSLTPHGPLLDEVIDQKGISLKWAFHHTDNRSLEGLYNMGLANGIDDFKKSVALGMAPGLNIVYADANDNIAHWVFGAIPKRPDHVQSDFLLNGSNGQDEYLGYLSQNEKPQNENPSSGFVLSANSRLKGKALVAGQWRTDERYRTIEQFLMQQEIWSEEGFKAIQTAPFNSSTQKRLEGMLLSLDTESFESNSLEALAYEKLKSWDYKANLESIGASIFFQWDLENFRLLLDELNRDEFEDYCYSTAGRHFYKRQLSLEDSIWWDLQDSKDIVEDRDDVLKVGFITAINFLKNELGENVNSWQWGRLHTIEFSHPLSKNNFLKPFVNLGPFPVMGHTAQVNNMRPLGCKAGLKVTAGPATRRVIDFANPKKSWGILPLGISGHPLSPFYQNQREAFLSGQYRRQYMSRKDIVSKSTGILWLKPEYD